MPHQDANRELLELSLSLRNISSLLENVVQDCINSGSETVAQSINVAVGYTQFVSERLLELGIERNEGAHPESASQLSRALIASAAA